MKHPARSDFDTAVTEAGVNVTFKPTNSIYSFYRLAESEDVARLGPVSLERVRHAGPSGDTEDYPSDEVQDMAACCCRGRGDRLVSSRRERGR
jgi:hypothetical protein